MNILEIPITGLTLNPNTPSQPNKSSDMLSGFDALLNTLMSQDPNLINDLNSGLLTKLNLTVFAGPGQIPESAGELTDGLKDLFSKLGDKLVELLSKLFDGNETSDKKGEFLQILDGIINNLPSGDNSGIKNILIKFLGEMKQNVSEDGLKGKLEKLAEGLSEADRKKIRSAKHRTEHLTPDQDTDMVKYKLLVGLFGLENPTAANADGTIPSTAEVKAAMQLKEILMVKFGIKPEAVNGQLSIKGMATPGQDLAPAKSDVVSTSQALVPSDTDVSKSESGISTEQIFDTPTNATNNQNAVHAVGVGVSDLKENNPLTGPIHAQGSDPDGKISQQIAGQTASTEGTSRETVVKHETANLASAKEIPAARPILETADTDKDSGDSKSSSEGTASSQQPYGFIADSKPSFATDLAQKVIYGTGDQETGTKPEINNPNQFIRQIVEKFDVLVSGEKSEARIQLKPRSLGEIKIHLTVEGGEMKAVLNASTHQAKQILEANLANLKQSLEEQGLQIKEFNVSVGHHQKNHGEEPGRQNRGSPVSPHERINMAKGIQDIKARLGLGSDIAVNYLA